MIECALCPGVLSTGWADVRSNWEQRRENVLAYSGGSRNEQGRISLLDNDYCCRTIRCVLHHSFLFSAAKEMLGNELSGGSLAQDVSHFDARRSHLDSLWLFARRFSHHHRELS